MRLASLTGEHPHDADVRRALAALGVRLDVGSGPEPALVAVLLRPDGARVTLR